MASGQPGDLSRWMPVAAAGGLLAVVVGVGVARGGGDGQAGSVASSVAAVTTNAPVTQPIVTTATTAPVVKIALDRTLGDGVTGDDVRMVQQRLTDLGFDLGDIDGRYGSQTIQAVWAFEKLVLGTPRAEATGRVTPAMWDRMQDPIQVAPRRPTVGDVNHVEVYLPEQVLAVFHENQAVLVAHTSSGKLDANGNPAPYCDEAVWDTDSNGNPYPEPRTGRACADAKTPGGVFQIHRMELGNHRSSLGGMTNPVYFNYGIAIHGADNVPLAPASHGCVRINQYLATFFQDLVAKGDVVLVWGEDGRQPEDYSESESLPVFDRREYDTTTTSTSTTTTTTPPESSTTTLPPGVTPTATTSTATPQPTPDPGTTTTTGVPVPTP